MPTTRAIRPRDTMGSRRRRTIATAATAALAAALLTLSIPAQADTATGNVVSNWQSSESGDRLTPKADRTFGASDGRSLPTITVDARTRLQYIDGFGATLNEAGCNLLNQLPATARADIFAKVFNPSTGAGYSLNRVPIGLNDFSLADYTLNDTPGDFSMSAFNLDRDKNLLIPCIKAAKAQAGDEFLLTSSPWTAPKWMKTNNSYFNGGSIIEPSVDSRYYQAFALYLRKYVEAMRAEGVKIDCVNPQNEPGYPAAFGSTLWTPQQMKTFIRDYMGPEFRNNSVNACIRGFEWNRDQWQFPDALMSDPQVAQYIAGINWHNYDCLNSTGCDRQGFLNFRALHPNVSNWMSEHTDIDGLHYEWSNGEKWGKEILDDIGLGHNGWIYWNLVLDQNGGPWSKDPVTGESRSGPQQAQIVVDDRTKSVTYLPIFYYQAQISKWVRPGAYHVKAEGGGPGIDFQAFTNKDGTRTLTVINSSGNGQELRVAENGLSFTVPTAAHSINTFTWDPHAPPNPGGGGAPTGPITGLAGKCVDVAAADSTNGTAVNLYDCNGTPAQTWTVGSDGALRALGKCLDIVDRATANGTKMQIWDCSGGANQIWRSQSDGTLRNPASGRCLDVTDNTSANGTRLQIYDCFGGPNQRWTLPS